MEFCKVMTNWHVYTNTSRKIVTSLRVRSHHPELDPDHRDETDTSSEIKLIPCTRFKEALFTLFLSVGRRKILHRPPSV